jgi:hypothetical protein
VGEGSFVLCSDAAPAIDQQKGVAQENGAKKRKRGR